LIYLYRRTLAGLRLHGLLSQSTYQDYTSDLGAAIQAEISTILHHTTGIPASGIVQSALPFPLLIAGSEAKSRNHMDIIRLRLSEILESMALTIFSKHWACWNKYGRNGLLRSTGLRIVMSIDVTLLIGKKAIFF
jgi:hypothetical protein